MMVGEPRMVLNAVATIIEDVKREEIRSIENVDVKAGHACVECLNRWKHVGQEVSRRLSSGGMPVVQTLKTE
jgi:hypothetical protein